MIWRSLIENLAVVVVVTVCSIAQLAYGQFANVINSPPTVIGSSQSIGSNTQLNVFEGGSVGSFFDAGASNGTSRNIEVNLNGGAIGNNFDVFRGSIVNVNSGRIGAVFRAYSGSTVNMNGGTVLGLKSFSGSLVNFRGGILDGFVEASIGSVVSVTGGLFKHYTGATNIYPARFNATAGSVVRISGGVFQNGPRFNPSPSGVGLGSLSVEVGSDVELFGNNFRLNGQDYNDDDITLALNDVFTGVLSDGSAFIFSPRAGDALAGVSLQRTSLPSVDATPIIVDGQSPTSPVALREGQSLTLLEGGVLSNSFQAIGATTRIEGGTVGDCVEIADGRVDINGGTVGMDFKAMLGAVVNVNGGQIDREFAIYDDSEVNIRGGSFFNGFKAYPGSAVNLFVREFSINGVEVDDLALHEPNLVTDRNVTISGILADGTDFDFDLRTRSEMSRDFFSPLAKLSVTMVAGNLAGDYNDDGVVNAADYTVWRDSVDASAGTLPNDAVGGVIGQQHFDVWAASYGQTLTPSFTAVPEPTSVVMLVMAWSVGTTRRRNFY
jgi:hypothetical protein